MAETPLAIAGLLIGLPEAVVVLQNYGEWLYHRAKTVKSANDTWKELANIGQSLSQGQFKLYVEQANKAYMIPDLDPNLKNSLADQIRRLELDLNEAQSILKKLGPNKPFSKFWIAHAGERKAENALKALRSHEEDLIYLTALAAKPLPSIEQNVVLSKDRFAVNEGIGYDAVPFTSNLFLASACYGSKATQTAKHSVLIEQQADAKTIVEEDIREAANILAVRLSDGSPRRPGVLKFLGYRMTPVPEFVFELPEDRQVQTLQALIAVDVGKEYCGGHPLEHRLLLARQVSLAVLTVHTMGLLHKNIRTQNILVLKRQGKPPHEDGFGDPYLTEWDLLRKARVISMHRPMASQWWQNIYRHPEVQDKGRTYNMDHDIYSLGVCLLEIGLWNPLVQFWAVDGQPEVSELFKREATVSDLAPGEDIRNIFRNASKVKQLLISLAQRYLPSTMGLAYMQFVVACLKVLDSPSALDKEIPDLSNLNDTEKVLAFMDLVLSSFPSHINPGKAEAEKIVDIPSRSAEFLPSTTVIAKPPPAQSVQSVPQPLHPGPEPPALEGHYDRRVALSGEGRGFADLQDLPFSAIFTKEELPSFNRHEVELRVKWEVPDAMRLRENGTRFSSILTITGNEIDAQAATCESYLQEHFKTGPSLLHVIQAAWDSKTHTDTLGGGLRRLLVKIDRSEHESKNVVVTASGTMDSIKDLTHALAWFCCAIRPAPSEKENFSLSTFQFDYHATATRTHSNITMNLHLLRWEAKHKDCCWHGLFKKLNIVLDGPISDRHDFGKSKRNKSGIYANQNI